MNKLDAVSAGISEFSAATASAASTHGSALDMTSLRNYSTYLLSVHFLTSLYTYFLF